MYSNRFYVWFVYFLLYWCTVYCHCVQFISVRRLIDIDLSDSRDWLLNQSTRGAYENTLLIKHIRAPFWQTHFWDVVAMEYITFIARAFYGGNKNISFIGVICCIACLIAVGELSNTTSNRLGLILFYIDMQLLCRSGESSYSKLHYRSYTKTLFWYFLYFFRCFCFCTISVIF